MTDSGMIFWLSQLVRFAARDGLRVDSCHAPLPICALHDVSRLRDGFWPHCSRHSPQMRLPWCEAPSLSDMQNKDRAQSLLLVIKRVISGGQSWCLETLPVLTAKQLSKWSSPLCAAGSLWIAIIRVYQVSIAAPNEGAPRFPRETLVSVCCLRLCRRGRGPGPHCLYHACARLRRNRRLHLRGQYRERRGHDSFSSIAPMSNWRISWLDRRFNVGMERSCESVGAAPTLTSYSSQCLPF